ncbi:3 5 -cyclic nucleotide phosphodiesterase domain-containing protein [Cystoisospora suis]|uniref:Phosphodiesterase n=1 Tax=Cystoisospora suis TaxID=483139 RepID=A0A2C6L759_9APIC|nr:3 5 -cyclic nucleotide phosphodiesterase domain-containing protein [Cystoisospora suis]
MWHLRRSPPQVGLPRLPGRIGGDGEGGGRFDTSPYSCCSSEHLPHHHRHLLGWEGEEERRRHWGRSRKSCRVASSSSSSLLESNCEDLKLHNPSQNLSVTCGRVSEANEKKESPCCFRSRRCHWTRENLERCSPGDKGGEEWFEKEEREMDDAVSIQRGENDFELPRNTWEILSVAIHTSPPGDTSDSLTSRHRGQRPPPQSSSKSSGSRSRANEYAISFRNSQCFSLGDPSMVEPQKRQSNSAHVYETPEEFGAGGTDRHTHPAVPSSPTTTPTSQPPQSAPKSDAGRAVVGIGEGRGSEGPSASTRGAEAPPSSSSACTHPLPAPQGRPTGSPVAQSPLGASSSDSNSSSGRRSPRRTSDTATEGRGGGVGEKEDQKQKGGYSASGTASSSLSSGTLLTPEGNHTRGGMELRAASVSDEMSMRNQGTGGGREGGEGDGNERRRQHLAGRFARLLGPQLASEESNATTAETTAPSPSSRPLPVLRPLRGGGAFPGGTGSQPSTIDEEDRRRRLVCLTSLTGSNLSVGSGSSKPPRSGGSVRSRDMSERHVGWRETSLGGDQERIGPKKRTSSRLRHLGEIGSDDGGATDGTDGDLDYVNVFDRSGVTSSLARGESSNSSKPKSHSFFLRRGHTSGGSERHGREMSAVGWLRKTSSRAKLLVAEGADAMFGAEINLFTGRQDRARELRRTSKGSLCSRAPSSPLRGVTGVALTSSRPFSMLPLKFQDESLEREYGKTLSRMCASRVYACFGLSMLVVCVFWPTMACTFTYAVNQTEAFGLFFFHIMWVLQIVGWILLLTAAALRYRVPFFADQLVVLSVLQMTWILTSVVAFSCTHIVNFISLHGEEIRRLDQAYGEGLRTDKPGKDQMFSGPVAVLTIGEDFLASVSLLMVLTLVESLVTVVCLGSLIPTRTRFTWPIYLLAPLLCPLPCTICNVEAPNFFRSSTGAVYYFVFLTVWLIGFVVRYSAECSQRVAFYCRVAPRKDIETLKEDLRRSQKQGGCTAVEELQHTAKCMEAIVKQVEGAYAAGTRDPTSTGDALGQASVRELAVLVSKLQEVLRGTDDLYSVRHTPLMLETPKGQELLELYGTTALSRQHTGGWASADSSDFPRRHSLNARADSRSGFDRLNASGSGPSPLSRPPQRLYTDPGNTLELSTRSGGCLQRPSLMEKLGRQLGLCAHPLHLRTDALQGEMPGSSSAGNESYFLAGSEKGRAGSRSTSPGSRLQHLLHDWPRSRNCSDSLDQGEGRRKSAPPAGVADLRRPARSPGGGHGLQLLPERGRNTCCTCSCHRNEELNHRDTSGGALITTRTPSPTEVPSGRGGDEVIAISQTPSPGTADGTSKEGGDSTEPSERVKDIHDIESRVRSASPGSRSNLPPKSCTLRSAHTEQTWATAPRGDSVAWSSIPSLGKGHGQADRPSRPHQGRSHHLFKIFPMGLFRKRGDSPTASVLDTKRAKVGTEHSQSLERPDTRSECPESADAPREHRHTRTPAFLHHAVGKLSKGEGDTRQHEKSSVAGSPSSSGENQGTSRKTSRDGPSRGRCPENGQTEPDGAKGRKLTPGSAAYEYTPFECELLGLQLRPLDCNKSLGKRAEDTDGQKRTKRRRADGDCASRDVQLLVGEDLKETLLQSPYGTNPYLESAEGSLGRHWSFDMLTFASVSPDIVVDVGRVLLLPYMEAINCSSEKVLVELLRNIQVRYLDNAYHNQTHAAEVAHATACLVRCLIPTGWAFGDVCSILAAVAHDVGHPGRSNAFLQNSYHPLSIIYNDASILENFHASLLFRIMSEVPGTNIFENIPQENFRMARQHIIGLILATDIKLHFEAISRFRLRRNSPEFNFLKKEEDEWLVRRMVMKTADLSHATVDWDSHFIWSCKVTSEFYQQGDMEVRLGLPVSPFGDREKHGELAKGQTAFLTFVVEPLLRELEALEASISHLITRPVVSLDLLVHYEINLQQWREADAARQVVLLDPRLIEFDRFRPGEPMSESEKRRLVVECGGGPD